MSANSYLTSLGLGEVNWLGQPGVAMISVVIATVWWTGRLQLRALPRRAAEIPRELYEAAATDGAVGIFTFVLAWNNFIWPFVITSAGALFTIPVGLATVQTSYGALYAQEMALAVLGALPLLVAFLLFQRQIAQGIANTGLKG